MQYINLNKNTDCNTKYSAADLIELLQQCSPDELAEISNLLKTTTKVDSTLNSHSDNPVKNATVTKELFTKADKNALKNVAYTGKYSDITCAPTRLPNPESLFIKFPTRNVLYDGTEAVKIDFEEYGFGDIYKKLDELMKFHPLTVNLSVSPNQFNKLQPFTAYTIKWSTNYSDIKDTKLYINNELQTVSGNSFSVSNTDIKDNVNISITVKNSKDTASNSVSINGYYPLFYGTNSDYKKNTSTLLNSNSGSFTVNAGINDYIYIISPHTLTFWVGGFEGGFAEQNTTTILDNNNKSITYYVYRSDNKNLGNTTVTWQQK